MGAAVDGWRRLGRAAEVIPEDLEICAQRLAPLVRGLGIKGFQVAAADRRERAGRHGLGIASGAGPPRVAARAETEECRDDSDAA